MRAAVFQGDGVVTIIDRDEPHPTGPEDVVIRVEVNGLCGSDLRALTVPPQMTYEPGTVIGHEFAGTVASVGGKVRSVSEGDRVVAIPNINCQICWYCTTNRTNLCENFVHIGSMRDGGAAEMVRVPERLIQRIPDGLATDLASLAEPLACVLNGTVSAGAQPGDVVLILGAGPIGLLYMLVFKGAGAKVIVSEPSEPRRLSASALGADIVVDPLHEDLGQAVKEATSGRGADICVDAVGRLLGNAVPATRKGGRILVFGLDDGSRAELSPATIAYGELRIEGVYIAKGTFPTALRLLEENTLGFERLITHRFALEDINQALAVARSGSAIKAVVIP